MAGHRLPKSPGPLDPTPQLLRQHPQFVQCQSLLRRKLWELRRGFLYFFIKLFMKRIIYKRFVHECRKKEFDLFGRFHGNHGF